MRPPDQNIRERIFSEFDRNFLVEASAGSGKTHSLVTRIVAGLASGQLEVAHTAVVTFTRKAAAELRSRLRLAVESQLQETAEASFENILSRLDRMFIGTLHSFCARILREHPVEAGLSPGFVESDEGQDRRLRLAVFRGFLESPRGRVFLARLSDSRVEPSDLHRALETVCDNGEVDFPYQLTAPPEPAPFWDEVDRFAAQLRERVPRPAHGCKCGIQHASHRFLQNLPIANRRQLQGLAFLLTPWEKSLKRRLKDWASKRQEQYGLVRPAEALIEEFKADTVAPFLRQWRHYLYGICLEALIDVRGAFHLERQRRGQLNFNDLLQHAVKLLRENPKVRTSSQAKYRHLFVDEFQDTDPLQAELLFFLSASGAPQEKDWSRLTPRAGSLFIVGDPKQSIYRFRRADIGTYNLVRQRLLECGGEVVSLTASYRSQKVLCDFTNLVFESMLPEQATDKQAPFSPLVPCIQPSERLSGLFRLTQDCAAAKDAVKQEACDIANVITGLVEDGSHSYGDFLILTRKRAPIEEYRDALGQRGIPHDVTGVVGDPSPFLEMFLELLDVVSNPDDTIALVGVLRGSLFGCSDDELYQYRQRGRRFYVQGKSDGSAVGDALAELHRLRQKSRGVPIGVAVHWLLEESGLVALAASSESGDKEVADLYHLAGQLRLAELEGRCLSEAIRLYRDDPTAAMLPLHAGQRDVVRVMNLHQAKGLEATVVFLAAPTQGVRPTAHKYLERDGAGAIGSLSIRNRYRVFAQPEDWDQRRETELDFQAREEERLLYVAVTRAKEALVVGHWTPNFPVVVKPWEALRPFLSEAPELAVRGAVPLGETAKATDLAELRALNSKWEQSLAQCATPSWERVSVTASARMEPTEQSSVPIPDEVARSEVGGAAWGDLVHRLLEKVVQQPEMTAEQLECLASWMTFESPELTSWIPEALAAVESLKGTPFWTRLLEAKDRHTEVPIGVALDGPQCRRLVFGVIDLALETDQGWEIVDYKTDRKTMGELVKRYSGQVSEYAKHWENVSGATVRWAGLYGVRRSELSADVRVVD